MHPSQRVSDSGNFLRFLPAIFTASTLAGLPLFLLAAQKDQAGNPTCAVILTTLIPMLPGLLAMWVISARMGATQVGMLVIEPHNLFVISSDPRKNTFSENVLKLRYIRDMFTMEELRLSDIYKITREYGKWAFIHGKFGIRRIAWRDKQKRDECIAALEMATGKKLASFDLGG